MLCLKDDALMIVLLHANQKLESVHKTISKDLKKVKEAVVKGKSITEPLGRIKYFPSLVNLRSHLLLFGFLLCWIFYLDIAL